MRSFDGQDRRWVRRSGFGDNVLAHDSFNFLRTYIKSPFSASAEAAYRKTLHSDVVSVAIFGC